MAHKVTKKKGNHMVMKNNMAKGTKVAVGAGPLDTSSFQPQKNGKPLVNGKAMPVGTQEDQVSAGSMKSSNAQASPALRSFMMKKKLGAKMMAKK